MARAAYLTKKDGRYWFQKRVAGTGTRDGGPSHLRFSLRTSDYRVAVKRMLRVMWTVEEYEVCPELEERGRFLLQELEAFNARGVPRTADELVERRPLELLVNRFLVEARNRCHPVDQNLPNFWPAWTRFCDESGEGENLAGRAERRAYELGRTHVEEALSEGWRDAPPSSGADQCQERRGGSPQPKAMDSAAIGSLPARDFGRRGSTQLDLPGAPAVGATAAAVPSQADLGTGLSSSSTLSEVRSEFLEMRRIADGDGRAAEDIGIVIEFAIELLGDRPMSTYTTADLLTLEKALPLVPNRTGIPQEHGKSLYTRYRYAQDHGWDGLKPISRKRLKNGWHRGLHAFLDWAIAKSLYTGPKHRFTLVSQHNAGEQERDAWKPEEMLRLFSLPLFTGCSSKERFWTPGHHFVQNEVYWGYILTFFTGMRPSEIGKLRTSDIRQHDGIWYIDLRRDKARPVGDTDLRRLKSRAAYRLIPLSQLILDLGLLERKADLEGVGDERLFPEWVVYTHPKSGRMMWGHHFSKSWQYIKRRADLDREALTLYGGRHTRAGWYDAAGIPQRVRNRILGHAPGSVADGYGPIDLTTEEARLVLSSKNSVEEAIAELLITAKLRAEYRQLTPLKTWLRTGE